MDLFERIKLILETQPYIPFDIGNVKNLATSLFLTPSNAMILHLTSLDTPNDHIPILPENAFTVDAQFSPDDSWVALPVDYSGKEDSNLFRLPTTHELTPIPLERLTTISGRHLWVNWNPEGSQVVWGFSQKKTNRVSVFDNKPDSEENLLWEGEGLPVIGHWKHSNLIKFTKIISKTNEFDEIIVNPIKNEIIHSLPVASSFVFYGLWNPTKLIFPYLARDNSTLSLFNLESQESIQLPTPEGEIEKVIWDLKGENLYFSASKDARGKIYSIHTESQVMTELPFPQGINKLIKIRKMENKDVIFYVHADATTRHNLWMYDLQTQESTQLTKRRSPEIETEAFPLVESISEHWNSTDGLDIHGFVMTPSSPAPKEGYPMVVFVHGGPMGQEVDSFVGTYQILAQEGFVVFRPNFRGSTGYGETFQRANFREIGKADLIDIVSGVNMCIDKYNVNPNKVIITGGSYGGYMTLRALTKPDIFEFCAGWAEAAISDWEFMYDKAVDELFKQFVVLLFGLMDNNESRQYLIESSPIHDWKQVSKPLGVVQFANDTRTPLKPVWDFVNNLYNRGDEVEFHVRPAMGHANIPKGYLIRSIARLIQFCQRVVE